MAQAKIIYSVYHFICPYCKGTNEILDTDCYHVLYECGELHTICTECKQSVELIK